MSFSSICRLGTLNEGEGPVQLTSSLRFQIKNIIAQGGQPYFTSPSARLPCVFFLFGPGKEQFITPLAFIENLKVT
jgi:hypothetical protein